MAKAKKPAIIKDKWSGLAQFKGYPKGQKSEVEMVNAPGKAPKRATKKPPVPTPKKK